jgi:hypothetical protein
LDKGILFGAYFEKYRIKIPIFISKLSLNYFPTFELQAIKKINPPNT